MSVKLVSITHPKIDDLTTAEELISYCARVSNSSNQMNMDSSINNFPNISEALNWNYKQ